MMTRAKRRQGVLEDDYHSDAALDDVEGPDPDPSSLANLLALVDDGLRKEALTKIVGLLSLFKGGLREQGAVSLGYRSYLQVLNAKGRFDRFAEIRAIKKRTRQVAEEVTSSSRGLDAINAAVTRRRLERKAKEVEVLKADDVLLKASKKRKQTEAVAWKKNMDAVLYRADRVANASKYASFVAAFVAGHAPLSECAYTPLSECVYLTSDSDLPDGLTAASTAKETWWPWEKKLHWLKTKAMLEKKIRASAADLMRHQAKADALPPVFSGTAPDGAEACLACHGQLSRCCCVSCHKCGLRPNKCNYSCQTTAARQKRNSPAEEEAGSTITPSTAKSVLEPVRPRLQAR